MNRRVALGVAAWLTVGVAATAAGTAAIGALEDGIAGSRVRPLDGADVRRALSREAASPSVTPPPTATPPPSDGGVTKVLAAHGGTVTARCAGGAVTLVSWTPAQGYRTGGVERGRSASLTFESASHEYHVTVTCSNGVPVASSVADDRGGRGRGRGRHGGDDG